MNGMKWPSVQWYHFFDNQATTERIHYGAYESHDERDKKTTSVFHCSPRNIKVR